MQAAKDGGDKEESATESATKDGGDMVESATEVQPSAKKPLIPKTDCNHLKYDIGVNYKEESMSACCKPGCDLFGVECAECNASFIWKGKAQRMVTFKPTVKKPAYCCMQRDKANCKHALCNFCWTEKYAEYIK